VQALLISLVAVAFAEVGDKTQLLALVLAARYRRPWPICAGILVATLVNHALAGEAGVLLAQLLSPGVLRWKRPTLRRKSHRRSLRATQPLTAKKKQNPIRRR